MAQPAENYQALLSITAVRALTPLQEAEATLTVYQLAQSPKRYYDHIRSAILETDVGGDAPGRWHVLTAQSYADVDALIVAVDVADPITLNELREELGRVVRGRRVQGRTEPFPVAKQGIPWLVLVVFKGEVMDEKIAREQVAALRLNELSIDWVFHPVAAGNGKDTKQSVSWLTKRPEEDTKEVFEPSHPSALDSTALFKPFMGETISMGVLGMWSLIMVLADDDNNPPILEAV
ncbi:hypothetical protein BO86DRAFT_402904 [Aspergillus japonicus CBS 114.51]|uniref:Uncharacterized protein n=1 Tax=Aspergillus japonicus CBS 114.51 TaxID=1448312 RepID=A0A8T8WS35_ASPJA|nr:hypothetical protein BO86DRAFT_402904 [Aspergillus japonicus CBS 114.51]RAH78362.1 hypothetical protein BO86DRAFT_402904 [Aspergillus japonicus CBS 114.51]